MTLQAVLDGLDRDEDSEASQEVCLPTSDFYAVLKDSIDETITGILGEKVHKALYQHLAEKRSLQAEAVPHKVGILCEVLEEVLGRSAARTIARAIARKLYGKLNIRFVAERDFQLSDSVQRAKFLFARDSESSQVKQIQDGTLD
jgi:hypothetical protein